MGPMSESLPPPIGANRIEDDDDDGDDAAEDDDDDATAEDDDGTDIEIYLVNNTPAPVATPEA